MKANKTLAAVELSNNNAATKEEDARLLAEKQSDYAARRRVDIVSFLLKADIPAELISILSSSPLTRVYTEADHPEGGSYNTGSYLEGSFTATLSEYENLTITGRYDGYEVRYLSVVAKTEISLLGFKRPYTRRSSTFKRIGQVGDFINKYGIAKTP